jgi:hypothetical protein
VTPALIVALGVSTATLPPSGESPAVAVPGASDALFVAVKAAFGETCLHSGDHRFLLADSVGIGDADLEFGYLVRDRLAFGIYGGVAGGAKQGTLGSFGLRLELSFPHVGISLLDPLFVGFRGGRFGILQQQDVDRTGYEAGLEVGAHLWRPASVFAFYTERWLAYELTAARLALLSDNQGFIGLGFRFQLEQALDLKASQAP